MYGSYKATGASPEPVVSPAKAPGPPTPTAAYGTYVATQTAAVPPSVQAVASAATHGYYNDDNSSSTNYSRHYFVHRQVSPLKPNVFN